MKKKLLIFILMAFCILIAQPHILHAKAESNNTEVTTITSNELPSNVYLQSQRRSVAASYEGSMVSSQRGIIRPFGMGWGDPTKPGDGSEWEESEGENMGGLPIGDASLPLVISILLLYFGYRRVSTTRRNNI